MFPNKFCFNVLTRLQPVGQLLLQACGEASVVAVAWGSLDPGATGRKGAPGSRERAVCPGASQPVGEVSPVAASMSPCSEPRAVAVQVLGSLPGSGSAAHLELPFWHHLCLSPEASGHGERGSRRAGWLGPRSLCRASWAEGRSRSGCRCGSLCTCSAPAGVQRARLTARPLSKVGFALQPRASRAASSGKPEDASR